MTETTKTLRELQAETERDNAQIKEMFVVIDEQREEIARLTARGDALRSAVKVAFDDLDDDEYVVMTTLAIAMSAYDATATTTAPDPSAMDAASTCDVCDGARRDAEGFGCWKCTVDPTPPAPSAHEPSIEHAPYRRLDRLDAQVRELTTRLDEQATCISELRKDHEESAQRLYDLFDGHIYDDERHVAPRTPAVVTDAMLDAFTAAYEKSRGSLRESWCLGLHAAIAAGEDAK